MAKKRPAARKLPGFDVGAMTLNLNVVLAIVAWVVSMTGLYWGLNTQISLQAERISTQTQSINKLTTQLEDEEKAHSALERAVIEVVATLKSKKVIQ